MTISQQAQTWFDTNLPGPNFSAGQIHAAIDYLERETRLGGECIPSADGPDAWRRVEPIANVAARSPHSIALAERFFTAWWMRMSAVEIAGAVNPHITGKASAAFNLSLIRQQRGDTSSYLRWCILAMIDDERLGNASGGAKEHLRSSAGLPAADVTALETAARAFPIQAGAAAAVPSAATLPEAIFVSHLVSSDSLHLHAAETSLLEHEVNGSFLERLITQAVADTTGALLETVCAYLASLLPRYQPRRNLLALDQTHQTDVVSRAVGAAPPVIDGQTGSILWESKNYADSVTVSIVGYLASRMLVTGAGLGILVSRQGVSSQSTGAARNAWQMIQLIHQRTNKVILSLTEQDLREIAENGSLVSVLHAQATRFLYGR